MLKKQTMWLLTMLTLVIVLSVYYVTNPDMGTNLVQQKGKNATATQANGSNVTVVEGTNQQLTQMRLQINDKRDSLKESLLTEAAGKDITAEKRNQLYEQSQQLAQVAEKESTVEQVIKAQGYADALVIADGNEVQVYVVSDKHSSKQANDIIQSVRKELGSKEVAVQFQVSKK